MKTLKIALLGFGSAGRAFGQLLMDKQQDIIETYHRKPVVTAIATGSRGIIMNADGIDVLKAAAELETEGAFDSATPGLIPPTDLAEMEDPSMHLLSEADYDVICELSPLNIQTGQPAIRHLRYAMEHGAHCVTANKGPLAWAYRDLKDLAEEKGVCFFYETTVMDGTPVFDLVEHTLKFCEVQEVSGILNSTSNFILEEMEKGTPYQQIMEDGKRRGFIEADPSMDIEGYDAAAKITALLNVLMDAGLTPDQVDRKGIEDVTSEQIAKLAAENKCIKQICRGWREPDAHGKPGKIRAEVKSVILDRSEFYSTVHGTTSVVTIKTDLMGTLRIVEEEPEIEQTAYGVFIDLIQVLDTLTV